MTIATFGEFVRSTLIVELEELHDEVCGIVRELDDQKLWRRPKEPGNSVGHLVLHLTGNLSHYVGAQLGNSDYVREREREFAETRPPSREQLLEQFAAAVSIFRRVVAGLTEEQMRQTHPHQQFGTVFKALVHLIAHFALHRGQMSYIARLVNEG